MEVSNLSTDGILKMYDAIAEALEKDDRAQPGTPKKFGVREYPDWRKFADMFEGVLDSRKVEFKRIVW